MTSELQLCIIFGDVRKLIFFQCNTLLSDFKSYLKEEFKIGAQNIILIDEKRNAEITSQKSFREDHNIIILVDEEVNQISEPPIVLNSNQVPSSENNFSKTIDFNELKGKKYESKTLLQKVNAWANDKKFQLYISEGLKKLKKA